MRKLVITLSALALSGCAIQHGELARYGDYELDGQLLKSFKVSAAGAAPIAALPGCVASTVTNDPVLLSDSAGSFVGAYTGRYYQAGSRREVGGGNTIQYVSPDGADLVAKGATMYASGLIQRSVRFTLRIRDQGQGRLYQFSGIEQAQTSTGSMPNTGYNRVHVAFGGGAEHVISSLKSITTDLESCIGSTLASPPAATQPPQAAGQPLTEQAYKADQLDQLRRQNLTYEEYQQRYREIMGE